MNKYKILTLISLSGLGGVLVSCDNIDENDRYESTEKPVLPPHSVPKTLLIQEFTGNMCTNCPQGAKAIHDIQEEFPGQVIAIGIHPEGGGPNTMPIGDQDFRCEEAQVIYEFFKPSGFPCAVFNGETTSTRFNMWYSIAAEMLAQEANMTIDAQSVYDSTTRNLQIDYTITATSDISTDLNVLVLLMENNILGYQLDGGKLLDNYIHNHVLRASLNGGWGTSLPSSIKNGQVIEGSASMILDDKWVAENCQVVVYTFQSATRIVEQATEIDIIQEPNEDDNME